MPSKETLINRKSGISIAAVIIAQLVILYFIGRIIVGPAGFALWTSSAWSSVTSQLFADPYSFSHFLHGIIFFAILHLFRNKIPLKWRFVIAVAAEVAWEILENSPIIINRYRDGTAALGYEGDSIYNSFGDTLFAMFGFYITSKLSWKWSLALLVFIEIILLILIRDNLTLNIVILIYPIEWIKNWQIAH